MSDPVDIVLIIIDIPHVLRNLKTRPLLHGDVLEAELAEHSASQRVLLLFGRHGDGREKEEEVENGGQLEAETKCLCA